MNDVCVQEKIKWLRSLIATNSCLSYDIDMTCLECDITHACAAQRNSAKRLLAAQELLCTLCNNDPEAAMEALL